MKITKNDILLCLNGIATGYLLGLAGFTTYTILAWLVCGFIVISLNNKK